VLFFMVALHIGAILIYKYVKKQSLTMAMLHGRAAHDVAAASPKDGSISAMRTLCGVVLLVGCVLAANALTLLRPALF